ncbi:Uncharacterised protein [Mycobacteroides abscessus subsp. abscessus]|nr:Uncharacterised protein [Mycobacteroides abscessus subsp. abscessus]SKO62740.1 Uncharacterised protein [Mycobacteroides abscessus subsp. abscessus]SLA06470.1 Uncharacterised protein [Mycobacteroides abscessus subsp. abscessus]
MVRNARIEVVLPAPAGADSGTTSCGVDAIAATTWYCCSDSPNAVAVCSGRTHDIARTLVASTRSNTRRSSARIRSTVNRSEPSR